MPDHFAMYQLPLVLSMMHCLVDVVDSLDSRYQHSLIHREEHFVDLDRMDFERVVRVVMLHRMAMVDKFAASTRQNYLDSSLNRIPVSNCSTALRPTANRTNYFFGGVDSSPAIHAIVIVLPPDDHVQWTNLLPINSTIDTKHRATSNR